jgi:hypothetical protein
LGTPHLQIEDKSETTLHGLLSDAFYSESEPQEIQMVPEVTGQNGPEPPTEHPQPRRNDQNSVRTLKRSLRPFINNRYIMKNHKFYQLNKSLDLLAVFKREDDSDLGLRPIQIFIHSKYSELLKKPPTCSKEQKLQAVVRFFLNIQHSDLEAPNLETTMKRMSEAGQLKKHPFSPENLNSQTFHKLLAKIVPAPR